MLSTFRETVEKEVTPDGGWDGSLDLGFVRISWGRGEGGDRYRSICWGCGFSGGGNGESTGGVGGGGFLHFGDDDSGGPSTSESGNILLGGGGGSPDSGGGGDGGHYDENGIWEQPIDYYARSLGVDHYWGPKIETPKPIEPPKYDDLKVPTMGNNKKLIEKVMANPSGAQGKGGTSTVEDVLRYAMGMKPGQQMTGNDIGQMNPKFSQAGTAIDNITKLSGGGVQVTLTSVGKGIVYFSKDYSDINGSVFNLSNFRNKNGIDAVHIQSPTAIYGGKPFDFYVNDNDFSIGGIWFSSLFHR